MIHTHLAVKHSWIIKPCIIFRGKHILFHKKYSSKKEKEKKKTLKTSRTAQRYQKNKYFSYDGLINMNNNMKINMKNSDINMMY